MKLFIGIIMLISSSVALATDTNDSFDDFTGNFKINACSETPDEAAKKGVCALDQAKIEIETWAAGDVLVLDMWSTKTGSNARYKVTLSGVGNPQLKCTQSYGHSYCSSDTEFIKVSMEDTEFDQILVEVETTARTGELTSQFSVTLERQ